MLKIVVLTVAFAWVGWLVFGLAAQRLLVFPRFAIPSEAISSLSAPVAGCERVDLATPAGTVEALFLPGDGVSAQSPGPALVFAHGNAELIDDFTRELSFYRRLGVSVLLVEYRGYGRSAGKPSEKAIVADFRQAYDRMTARPEVDNSRIVFHGRSLGGGVVCSLARECRPAALVLQSTFTSLPAMTSRFLFPGALMRDRFDNAGFLAGFDGPVLLLHGREDTIVPLPHSVTLERIARDAKLVTFDCGHNDFLLRARGYHDVIATFLREHRIVRESVPGLPE